MMPRFCTIALLAFLSFAAREKEEPSPNILWICTDQQRWDTIGALNNPYVNTPNLNKLVRNGVAFTHAFVQSPVCTPSRASFLTGMYPSTIHNTTNGGDTWDNPFPLIPQILSKNGYSCGLSGKLHLSSTDGRIEPVAGLGYDLAEISWSHHPWDSWPEGNEYIEWLEGKGRSYDRLYDSLGYIPEPYHQTTWCVENAIDFVGRKKGEPWFYSLNIFDPHNPYDPPQKYLDRYEIEALPGPCFQSSDLEIQNEKLDFVHFQTSAQYPEEFKARELQARYWAMIDQIDYQLGRLFEVLKETGQLDNTIIIFTADHGDMVGDHGLQKKGCRFYEGLVRVPLIISWPDHYQKGIVADGMVELIDLFPTIMEAVELPIHDKVQGRSLTGILTGKESPDQFRGFVRSEYYDALDHTPKDYATMIRDSRFKLVVYHGYEYGELYDLQNDPCEHQNLWNDQKYEKTKLELLRKSFDQTVKAVDTGPVRIGNY